MKNKIRVVKKTFFRHVFATNFLRFATKISPLVAEVRPPSFLNFEPCPLGLFGMGMRC